MPIRRAVRMTRQAISPRLAISTFLSMRRYGKAPRRRQSAFHRAWRGGIVLHATRTGQPADYNCAWRVLGCSVTVRFLGGGPVAAHRVSAQKAVTRSYTDGEVLHQIHKHHSSDPLCRGFLPEICLFNRFCKPISDTTTLDALWKAVLALYYMAWVFGTTADVNFQEDVSMQAPNQGRLPLQACRPTRSLPGRRCAAPIFAVIRCSL